MHSSPEQDARFMREALTLAQAGAAQVSPNPAVGAVLVKGGRVVGRGMHTYEGRKHAEVLAIEDAGPEHSRGATLYLNLEPCSHYGRTPPCADAVISAGVSRVVCAMQDPNPEVSGQGFVRLRAAGVVVDVGMYEAEAKELNESFAKWIRTGRPFVTLKAGMSLDGKIAPGKASGVSRWITSEAARNHAQGLRHTHDAILVGVGTVVADDPSLTDRTGLVRRRPLLRIVVDEHLKIPIHSKLVDS
ncbi:MAG: bifunctional diaminohydroxyphosphoribosylaminopyrimidine deaminase/5-amino-6-(5-phosphoribosylamino)uracil reductase RibD, partial [Acidobacteriales bacterium]|nr:bifunctional diaminohydroxyphosphoribosylaminopyrimidine deaminase/5-amino-6-(5-phosphoribosylamino)uracil reductase RibD [Terriglobales bacterium]